jgi:hypothetical protein
MAAVNAILLKRRVEAVEGREALARSAQICCCYDGHTWYTRPVAIAAPINYYLPAADVIAIQPYTTQAHKGLYSI